MGSDTLELMNMFCCSGSAKKSEKGVNLLASLCNIYQASEDELKSTIEKVNNLILDILKKKPRPASECKSENLDHIITGQNASSEFFLNSACCLSYIGFITLCCLVLNKSH